MARHATFLDLLQSQSQVDCDTLDTEVARDFDNIIDCTSNQAIAYGELQKPQHERLLKDSVIESKLLFDPSSGISQDELAVEIAMIKLSLRIAPYISGLVHIQTNPRYAYNTEATVSNALRIMSSYKALSDTFDASRICVKIPSTFEGLQACRVLNSRNVKTLATTLFTIEQAVLAADAGCHYIAPYLNALKAQIDESYQDAQPEFELCISAQRYFEAHHISTKVLGASFTSIDDVMKLAGIHHLTLPPKLLDQLRKTLASQPVPKSLFEEDTKKLPEVSAKFLYQREAFVKATERGFHKLSQALEIFCDMQTKLESLTERTRKGEDI